MQWNGSRSWIINHILSSFCEQNRSQWLTAKHFLFPSFVLLRLNLLFSFFLLHRLSVVNQHNDKKLLRHAKSTSFFLFNHQQYLVNQFKGSCICLKIKPLSFAKRKQTSYLFICVNNSIMFTSQITCDNFLILITCSELCC